MSSPVPVVPVPHRVPFSISDLTRTTPLPPPPSVLSFQRDIMAALTGDPALKSARILSLFSNPSFATLADILPFCSTSPKKQYTRNLLALTPSYALLALCWRPRSRSPVHAHAGAGCWVKILQGALREIRYAPVDDSGVLGESTSDFTAFAGEVTYIDDGIGVHAMENPGDDVAVSLHCYAPAYRICKVYGMRPDSTEAQGRERKVQEARVTFDTVFGRKVTEEEVAELMRQVTEDTSQSRATDPMQMKDISGSI